MDITTLMAAVTAEAANAVAQAETNRNDAIANGPDWAVRNATINLALAMKVRAYVEEAVNNAARTA